MQENDINISRGYDSNGSFLKLELHIPYSDLKTFKFPKSCINCPVGFMDCGCGRNVPFMDEDCTKRPSTCKLEQIFIEDIIKMISRIED